jgi:hypothetical protein
MLQKAINVPPGSCPQRWSSNKVCLSAATKVRQAQERGFALSALKKIHTPGGCPSEAQLERLLTIGAVEGAPATVGAWAAIAEPAAPLDPPSPKSVRLSTPQFFLQKVVSLSKLTSPPVTSEAALHPRQLRNSPPKRAAAQSARHAGRLHVAELGACRRCPRCCRGLEQLAVVLQDRSTRRGLGNLQVLGVAVLLRSPDASTQRKISASPPQ